jgi:hypothetical protein
VSCDSCCLDIFLLLFWEKKEDKYNIDKKYIYQEIDKIVLSSSVYTP